MLFDPLSSISFVRMHGSLTEIQFSSFIHVLCVRDKHEAGNIKIKFRRPSQWIHVGFQEMKEQDKISDSEESFFKSF